MGKDTLYGLCKGVKETIEDDALDLLIEYNDASNLGGESRGKIEKMRIIRALSKYMATLNGIDRLIENFKE